MCHKYADRAPVLSLVETSETRLNLLRSSGIECTAFAVSRTCSASCTSALASVRTDYDRCSSGLRMPSARVRSSHGSPAATRRLRLPIAGRRRSDWACGERQEISSDHDPKGGAMCARRNQESTQIDMFGYGVPAGA